MANRAVGKVSFISVQGDATLIGLDIDKTNGPLDGIFKLLPSDPELQRALHVGANSRRQSPAVAHPHKRGDDAYGACGHSLCAARLEWHR